MAIESGKKDAPEKESRISNWIIFGLAFAFAGIILYASVWQAFHRGPPKTEMVEYQGFDFEHIEGMWYTKWQKGTKVYSVPLRFNPLQVENVTILGAINESFNRRAMYVAFDPTKGNFSIMALAAGELSLSMVRALGVTPIAACTKNDTACEGRPIVDCPQPNATVILLQNEGDPAIWLRGDCIALLGSGFDLVRSVDRLLYSWYGIMR